MTTSILEKFCKFCLRNYEVNEYTGALEPVCNCEKNFEYIMNMVGRDIEQ